MSVQVFQALILLSAKYKYNMDKEQGRVFWTLRGGVREGFEEVVTFEIILIDKEEFFRWPRGNGNKST